MKRTIIMLAMLLSVAGVATAQTIDSHIVEGGGRGPYKAEIVADESLPAFTIYRPQNLSKVVAEIGRLPLLLYGNGGCANNNVEMRLLLSEVVSQGYIAIAIGPYDEKSAVERWKEVLLTSFPAGKKVILANGEEFVEPTAEQREEMMRKEAEARRAAQQSGNQAAPQIYLNTTADQLLEALDWITDRNAEAGSEYYHSVDLHRVAVMGQSCGGAQALAVSHDPRISTTIMLNSGIGNMTMEGVDKAQLENVEVPMLYLIGGEGDVAYPNSKLDYERLSSIPVALINTPDGHSGTFYEKNGGPYAEAVTRWLNWQLRGNKADASIFLDDESLRDFNPTWVGMRKNF